MNFHDDLWSLVVFSWVCFFLFFVGFHCFIIIMIFTLFSVGFRYMLVLCYGFGLVFSVLCFFPMGFGWFSRFFEVLVVFDDFC